MFTFFATYQVCGGYGNRYFTAKITVPVGASVEEIRNAIAAATGQSVRKVRYSVNPKN